MAAILQVNIISLASIPAPAEPFQSSPMRLRAISRVLSSCTARILTGTTCMGCPFVASGTGTWQVHPDSHSGCERKAAFNAFVEMLRPERPNDAPQVQLRDTGLKPFLSGYEVTALKPTRKLSSAIKKKSLGYFPTFPPGMCFHSKCCSCSRSVYFPTQGPPCYPSAHFLWLLTLKAEASGQRAGAYLPCPASLTGDSRLQEALL